MRWSIAVAAVALALVVGIKVGADRDFPVLGGLHDVFVNDPPVIEADDVKQLIEDDYYKPVDRQKLRDSSINGMVRSLKDPFTHYFDPKQNKLFEQAISGSYSGVGMAVNGVKKGLRITVVYNDTPAKQQGLKVGDLIIAVNGKRIAGESADLAVARIKGREGTEVKLTVRSQRAADKSYGPAREVKLTRARVRIPITDRQIVKRSGRKWGVERFASFVEGSGEVVRKDVEWLRSHGAQGIVLDLRGNGGGRLDQAIAVASAFIGDGTVVSTDGRARRRKIYKALGNAIKPSFPLVVLVDRDSASASEIVSGAVQDRDRGTVVGTRTFGKGVFQEVTELTNGGAIAMTVGEYFLPSGRSINKKGVQPEVKAVDRISTPRDEALDIALKALATAPGSR